MSFLLPVATFIGGYLMGLDNPASYWIARGIWKSFPVRIPSEDALTQMWVMGLITDKEYENGMEFWGYSKEWTKKTRELYLKRLEASDLVTLYWRGEIDEKEYLERMRRLGFTDSEAKDYEKASRYYPSPSDIVRFAVREVYNPEARKRLALDADMPDAYLAAAKKAGLSEEFARDYWAAHWELPSIEAGFEMFHRGIITEEELKDLLKALDYSPAWRDKLIKLSYIIPTRVDARRMLAAGVITPDDLYKIHLAEGYSPEDAKKLTEWAVKEYLSEAKELTKEEIKEMLEFGEINEEDAVKYLMDLDYSKEVAEMLVHLWMAKIKRAEAQETAELLIAKVLAGEMTREQFNDELNKLALPTGAVRKYLAKLDKELEKKRLKELETTRKKKR
jgi:hypothetical protein